MASALGDLPIRPLTVPEVMAMVDAGILREDERVELLHGVLTRMSPKSRAHGAAKLRLTRWLKSGDGYDVRYEEPLLVPDRTSLPEPDIAIVKPDASDYADALPSTALLVVEVSIGSLKIDTEIKPALYAAAGVPDCWVVDVNAKRLRVYRDPTPDGYATQTVLGPEGLVEPLLLDVAPLDLAALFDDL